MLSKSQLFSIFFNEYAVKINCQRRNSRWSPRLTGMSVLVNEHGSRFFEFCYVVVYNLFLALGMLSSLFRRRVCEEKIFIVLDPRLSSYNLSGLPTFRVGPHLFFRSSFFSIYQLIGRAQLFKIALLSLCSYSKACEALKASCVSYGVCANDFKKMVGFGYFRYLELNLAHAALLNVAHVESAGHFDVYTGLISLVREQGALAFVRLYQHGLYEKFLVGKMLRRFFSDSYVLRYVQSKKYFLSDMNANPAVKITFAEAAFKPNAMLLDCIESEKIAYALQNDCYEEDFLNIQYLQNLKPAAYIALYLHPATPKKIVRTITLRFPGLHVFLKERHLNIDVVVSRYSSLVLDYGSLGVKGVFIAQHDQVCAFDSEGNEFKVVYSLEQLRSIL